ncbi:MAG: hypothetical protein Q9226_004354 [Calogaya cf. arnoldii]
MSPPQIKIQEAVPVDGNKTFIISTQTFKYQLDVPKDLTPKTRRMYFDLICGKTERINSERNILQRTTHLLATNPALTSSRLPGPASLEFSSTVTELHQKLLHHKEELKALQLYFDMLRRNMKILDWGFNFRDFLTWQADELFRRLSDRELHT